MKRLYGCLLFAACMTARAEVVQIAAEFEPAPAKPHSNEFKNTTKDSGYCAENPFSCQEGNGFERLFSIETGIDVQSIRPIPARHTNPRQRAMFDISAAQWRDVTVLDAGIAPRPCRDGRAGAGANDIDFAFFMADPGTLHFSLEQDGVRQMLELGSAKFSGDVTVIWDSEV
ncbi:hypothetical protein EAH72_10180 [Pseudomonas caspiana]|nr:hypothetical protein [Pseudomonas caspiana]TPG96578.1 hypothetical protein EAH72_10180 [Pseudomonas caspiana]